MRSFFRVVAVGALVAMPLFAPPSAGAQVDPASVLPSDATIAALMTPLTVSSVNMVQNSGGWDRGMNFQLNPGPNGPPVPVSGTVAASSFGSADQASAFIQSQAQQYGQATQSMNLQGQIAPTPAADLSLKADEVYFGTFESAPGAAQRTLVYVVLARYGTLVTDADTSMFWPDPGAIGDDDRKGLGGVTGVLAGLIDKQVP
jgi:hypothetical protein